MKEFEGLIRLGRTMKAFGGSKRCALIQLEGNVAYLTNTKRSVLYKITFERAIGDGTFYAGEAPIMSEKIQRRDEKVLFEWKEAGVLKRVLIPDCKSFAKEAEVALGMYVEPNVKLPDAMIAGLNTDILITGISVKGNELAINQTRSDGTVSFENIFKLGRGFVTEDYPSTGIVKIFTSDLSILRDVVTSPMLVHLEEDKPMSLKGKLDFGADLVGLIAHLSYSQGE